MEWMLTPLRRYADFSGRSRRKEYWMFILFTWLLYMLVAAIFFGIVGGSGVFNQIAAQRGDPTALMAGSLASVFLVFGVLWLGLLIPTIAVLVRRFHDQDKSGWFALILLGTIVPLLGWLFTIALIVFMCIEGTRGENRFGPDPKGENIADVFA